MRLHAVKAWYDSREGMVEVEDDVLSIVRQVREMYGDKISVELDPKEGMYHFIEHGEDGTDRLIFSTFELTPKELERLIRADGQMRHHEDPYAAAEREQDAAQEAIDERNRQYVREAGELLAWALKREGKMPRLPLSMPVSMGKKIA